MKSLWGEEFTVEKTPEKAKKIIKKLDNKNISEIKKIPKSKNSSVSLTERLSLIKSEVLSRSKKRYEIGKTARRSYVEDNYTYLVSVLTSEQEKFALLNIQTISSHSKICYLIKNLHPIKSNLILNNYHLLLLTSIFLKL